MRRAQLIAALLVVGGAALAVPGVPQAAGTASAPEQGPGTASGPTSRTMKRTGGAGPGEAAGGALRAVPAIRSVTVLPHDPVVRARGGVDLTVEVVARGAAGPDAVTVRLDPGPPPPPPERDSEGDAQTRSPSARALPALAVARAFGGHGNGRDGGAWEVWSFRGPVKLSRLYPTGVWTVEARVRGASGSRAVEYTTFLLRGVTRLRDLRVAPDEAGGDAVRVSGRLTRLDPSGLGGQRGFRGRQVAVQYLNAQVGTWRTAAWTVTGRGGSFAASVPRRDAVRWRVVYGGDEKNAPVRGEVDSPGRSAA